MHKWCDFPGERAVANAKFTVNSNTLHEYDQHATAMWRKFKLPKGSYKIILELNGFNASKISNDDVYDLVIWIASTNASLEDITTRLSRLLARRRRR